MYDENKVIENKFNNFKSNVYGNSFERLAEMMLKSSFYAGCQFTLGYVTNTIQEDDAKTSHNKLNKFYQEIKDYSESKKDEIK